MHRKFVAYFLALTLSLAPSGFGQARGYLTLRVLDGDNAFNDIRRREAHAIVIEVRDDANNLVPGARVTFTLPMIGAGGAFAGGKTASTVTADSQGLAHSEEFKPNTIEGRFNIRVTATSDGKEGSIVVAQTNTLAGGGGSTSHKKLFIILAVVGAGAGAGIALGMGGGSKTTTPPPTPTVLTSGGVTVGAPF